MRRAVFLLITLAITATFVLTGVQDGSTPAGRSSRELPLAEVVYWDSGIGWVTKIAYEQAALTVVCPDGVIAQKAFTGVERPYIMFADLQGSSCPDGEYVYELRFTPPGQLKVRDEAESMEGGPVKPSLVFAGTFRVLNAAVVPGGIPESGGNHLMDVVHADDVIITGSLCVGFDCLTDGTENFGFDTIKMKENNIRIFFDDTSSTAGFPANDWRIIANDSSSGGADYISIEDSTGAKTPFRIDAGARTNAIRVSSTGRVGLGTATPVLNLHIVHGDTPSVRLDQDTSSGWTAQVWDIAGNESNFFVRDTTGGSKLPFRIQPGTPTNSLTLKSDGKVGIGTWSPTKPLELSTTGLNACLLINRTDGAQTYINATNAYGNIGTQTNHPFRLAVNAITRMTLNIDGSLNMSNGASCTAGGVWTNASSRELKENIAELDPETAMQALAELNPVTFNYKVDKEEKHVGFIAEEAPDLVAVKDRKGMSPMDVVAVLTKVVQEQQKTIQAQQQSIEQLSQKVIALEKVSAKGRKR